MSSAFVIIDVQKTWSEQNPLTAKRIHAAARSLRETMPVVWVYMNRHAEDRPVTLARPGLLHELFNTLHNGYKPSFRPSGLDFVLTKTEANAFAGTDLERFLNRRNLKTLYFAGFLSSQCVFSTAANGAELGFDSHIVTDLTSDYQDQGPIFCQNQGVRAALQARNATAMVNLTTSRDIGLNLP